MRAKILFVEFNLGADVEEKLRTKNKGCREIYAPFTVDNCTDLRKTAGMKGLKVDGNCINIIKQAAHCFLSFFGFHAC